MSDHANDLRYRRYLPSEPLNKYPTSPTIPVAKLRLYTELYGNRDLRHSNRSHSISPVHWRTGERVAMSCPGTPVRSNGYISPAIDSFQRPTSLYHGVVPKISTTSNLLALSPPSLPSLPSYFQSSSHHQPYYSDRYNQHGLTTTSNHQRIYSDRYNQHSADHPHSSSSAFYSHHAAPSYSGENRHHSDYGRYPLSHSAELTSSRRPTSHSSLRSVPGHVSYDHGLSDREYRRTRLAPALHNNNLVHNSGSLRDAIKNELKHLADDRKRSDIARYNNELQPSDPLFSSSLPLTSSSYLSPYHKLHSNYRHHRHPSSLSSAISRNPHQYDTHHPHHRSDSDLNALLDLYSDPPDPWMEKSPPPGVPIIQGLPQGYLTRNASYPSSIDNLYMHSGSDHLHSSPFKTSSPYRHAQPFSNYLGRYKYRY